jgi:2-iminobutanoate/2-iminopropanoate deaminase
MSIERILHQGAPTPRGPYASAVRAGDFIFVSGLGPVGDDDKYVFGDIQQQTRQTLLNLCKILEDCGARLEDVVKCSVFLRDASEFPKMNEVYAEFFGTIKPARTTVEARFFQGDMRVEIDCVAYLQQAAVTEVIMPTLPGL